MSNFTDKTLLITGGTGSFGNAVLRRFLDSGMKEIRIFSRDENNSVFAQKCNKQKSLRVVSNSN